MSSTIGVENISHTNGTNAATVDSSGKVGIGTSSPTTALTLGTSHTATVQNGGSNSVPAYAITSGALGVNGITAPAANTLGFVTASTERMRIDGSGNVDVKSSGDTTLKVTAGGTSNDSKIDFVHGTTTDGGITYDHNGAYASEEMIFRTGNNTPNMRLNGQGNLLLGKTTYAFDNVTGTAIDVSGQILLESSNGVLLRLNRKDGNGHGLQFYRGATNIVGSITFNTSSVAYNTSSDHRLKENVTADWDATTRLKQLNPVRFNFIADTDTTVDGFLAHEVQSVVPEAITGTHNEVDDDGNPVYQGIDQSKLVPLLVKTIQELEARITALENG